MSEPFFPNQSAFMMEQELRIRAIAGRLSEPECLEIYSAVSNCAPSLSPTRFRIEDAMVIAEQHHMEIAFPRPVPMVKMSHIVFGYEQWLQRKYCLPGFVEVEAGDVVVDCGAYVGGFARSAARSGAQVYAFEPDLANAACVERNLAEFPNAIVQACGLYDRSGEMTLNISANSVEHSLLMPDDGTIVGTRLIPVVSLYDYASRNGIERYDFVKIEAEGVELEVFAGLVNLKPLKLAIDVSPERNGESPAEEFRMLLEAQGYEVRQRNHVMFARLGSGSFASVATGSHAQDPENTSAGGYAVRAPSVPRVIYTLWLQGFEAAPALVQLNMDRWAALNPGYRLQILDRNAVNELLPRFPFGIDRLTPQALSDVVRARLLSIHGGIWVDASVFPMLPLDEWLPSVMTSSGFFAFEKPGPDRPISSWFLASSENNPIPAKWWTEVNRYWEVERSPSDEIPDHPVTAVEIWHDRYPYFWFHYLFQALLDRDPEFALAWAASTKVSADGPHALQIALAERPDLAFTDVTRIASEAPLHKLNWRAGYPLDSLALLGPAGSSR